MIYAFLKTQIKVTSGECLQKQGRKIYFKIVPEILNMTFQQKILLILKMTKTLKTGPLWKNSLYY